MSGWRGPAARNNAEWCAAVCRSHGIVTELGSDVWTSATRTPPVYPDAVTLVPDVAADSLLERVDSSAGCSVKDSFATLDLHPHGFDVLFDAEWIVHERATHRLTVAQDELAMWSRVEQPDALAEWEEAWRTDESDPVNLFRAGLLGEPSVAIFARRDGTEVVAGAVLNHGPTGIVGVSNLFTRSTADESRTWSAVMALAEATFPGSTVVGYERGDELNTAVRQGFARAGPLRVWMRR